MYSPCPHESYNPPKNVKHMFSAKGCRYLMMGLRERFNFSGKVFGRLAFSWVLRKRNQLNLTKSLSMGQRQIRQNCFSQKK